MPPSPVAVDYDLYGDFAPRMCHFTKLGSVLHTSATLS